DGKKNRIRLTKTRRRNHHSAVTAAKFLPRLTLKSKRLETFCSEPAMHNAVPFRLLELLCHYLISFFTSSISSISSTFLSRRQRRIRGKRRATPLLCRLLKPIPSNAISNTSSGLTVRTGPNFSSEFLVTNRLTSIISLSVSPE